MRKVAVRVLVRVAIGQTGRGLGSEGLVSSVSEEVIIATVGVAVVAFGPLVWRCGVRV